MNFDARIAKYGPSRKHVANEYVTRMIARKCIMPGDSVIDLGANEGFHTFDFANSVGSAGKVHAFEPNPSLWKNFIDKPPIRLWPFAVGNDISVQNFYVPENSIYHQVGSIVDPRDFIGDVPVKIVSVPQIDIDHIEEIFVDPVSFVKIDVERREYQAISGMRNLIEKYNPVIVAENITDEIRDVLSILRYRIFPLVQSDNVNVLANSLAIHSSKCIELERITPSVGEIDEILRGIEGQYPDDVV